LPEQKVIGIIARVKMRGVSLMGLSLLAASSMAEDYVAKVYGSPAGYQYMQVDGAGDGGMMTGFLKTMGNDNHAGTFTPQGVRDLHPAGFIESEILDSWGGTYHVGNGHSPTATPHALFWVGGGPAVDLHPPGSLYVASYGMAGYGNQQAGIVSMSDHCPTPQCGAVSSSAGVWNRTAASFRRLHCSVSYSECQALSTDGLQQGGFAGTAVSHNRHAMIWTGPDTFGKDIHPSGCIYSEVRANWEGQQGGVMFGAVTGSQEHAAFWTGTAQSCVDLNPSPFLRSQVTAVRNGTQVGYGNATNTSNRDQALMWHGNAAGWVNLHFRLPAMFWTWHSYATDIDNLGNVVGYIANSNFSLRRPVIWERQD
jgi:hypothetical protein